MPSLIDLRRRIRAVKSTQQITKAMKMIAASRLRRAQDRIINARPFAREMLRVLNSLAARVDATAHPLLSVHEGQPASGRVLLVVVTADKGLCGSFNSNIIKEASRFIDALNRSDRVALEIIPGTGPVTDFTANHGLVKAMVERAVGQAVEASDSGRVGIAESVAAIERGDDEAWASILERECVNETEVITVAQCKQRLDSEVRTVYTNARNTTTATLVALRGIIDRLAWTSEPKSLVLISEGLVVDRNFTTLAWVGPQTAAAHVSLYGIRMSAPLYDVQIGRTSPTREADQLLTQPLTAPVGPHHQPQLADMARPPAQRHDRGEGDHLGFPGAVLVEHDPVPAPAVPGSPLRHGVRVVRLVGDECQVDVVETRDEAQQDFDMARVEWDGCHAALLTAR